MSAEYPPVIIDETNSTELTVANQQTAVAVNDADALAAMMLADAGAGSENVTAADMSIPFLKLLQSKTPQADENDPNYIEGAKAGMWLNTVTGDLLDIRSKDNKYAVVIPVYYNKEIVEWRPNNGGIVRRHPMNQALLDACHKDDSIAKGKLINDDGNIMEETAYHYVLVQLPSGEWGWGIIACTGTKLTPSKKWVGLRNGKTILAPNGARLKSPLFGYSYKVDTFLDTSKRDSSIKYMNYRFSDNGQVKDFNLYQEAKAFYDAVKTGKAKAADEAAAADAHVETDTDGYHSDF